MLYDSFYLEILFANQDICKKKQNIFCVRIFFANAVEVADVITFFSKANLFFLKQLCDF